MQLYKLKGLFLISTLNTESWNVAAENKKDGIRDASSATAQASFRRVCRFDASSSRGKYRNRIISPPHIWESFVVTIVEIKEESTLCTNLEFFFSEHNARGTSTNPSSLNCDTFSGVDWLVAGPFDSVSFTASFLD